ncbi:CHAD domain-containing protein [Amycolatopsis sp. CB00013]|uniref:CHAD domain-containing protein n=1 Tax=Amycolatopsis sp. CB00013 TaxID=1703945 RepID=UPI003FCE5EF5
MDSSHELQLLIALDVLEVVLSERHRQQWPKAARRPAERVLPHRVRAMAEKVDARVSGDDARPAGPERDRAVHGVRKAAKRLRYALEAGAEALPVDAKPALRAFQDLLGEIPRRGRRPRALGCLGGRGRYPGGGPGTGDGQRRSMRGRAAGDLARSPPCTSSVMDLAPDVARDESPSPRGLTAPSLERGELVRSGEAGPKWPVTHRPDGG